jgi:cell division protein FtsI (penicillin-binding protein 3)
MAKNLKLSVEDAHDSLSVLVPEVKGGDVVAANYVLSHLGISSDEVDLQESNFAENTMPSTIGMGASDAVYLLEQQGVKVTLSGTGQVKRQSVAPGTVLKPGMTCVLELN